MLNKSKKRRVLYLTLLGITLLLSLAIGWLYVTVQSGYGDSAASLALMVATVIIMGLVCKGIQYAAAIEKAVQYQAAELINHRQTKNAVKPNTIEIFGQMLHRHPVNEFNLETPDIEMNHKNQGGIYELDLQPHKRRGKHSRFPISKITKTVLKWEQRDPQFTSLTLTEFLEQEFGAGPDGILLMAPTTFYDWRRRVLRDLELKNKEQSSNQGAEAF
jgi:hypothetical protein